MSKKYIIALALIASLGGSYFYIYHSNNRALLDFDHSNVGTQYINPQSSAQITVKEYKLKNGIRAILSRNCFDTVKLDILINAGSNQDQYNNSGTARYLAQSMFQGTKNIGTINWHEESKEIERATKLYEIISKNDLTSYKDIMYYNNQINNQFKKASQYLIYDEYGRVMKNLKASDKVHVMHDYTQYTLTFNIKNLLPILKVQQERFTNPAIGRNFNYIIQNTYKTFNKLQYEKSYHIENGIYGMLFPDIIRLRSGIIGSASDLQHPSPKIAQEFFEMWYKPANITLLLSGNIDFNSTLKMLDSTFGKIKTKSKLKNKVIPLSRALRKSQVNTIYTEHDSYVVFGFKLDTAKQDIARALSKLLNNRNTRKRSTSIAIKSYYANISKNNGALVITIKNNDDYKMALSHLNSVLHSLKDGDYGSWLLDAAIADIRPHHVRDIDKIQIMHLPIDALISKITSPKKVTKNMVSALISDIMLKNHVALEVKRGNAHKVTIPYHKVILDKTNNINIRSQFVIDNGLL